MVSRNRCWLPVLSNRPSCYPSQLPWKGEGLGCHVCSLNSSVSVSTTSNTSLPLVYGTQVYFTQPVLIPGILTSNESPVHLVAHLQVMIDSAKHFTPKEMFDIVHEIYSAMLKVVKSGSLTDFSSLKSIGKWIYIKGHNKFVSPSDVAMEQNVSFRHNLEPYLHKLPDSISDYSSLFTSFGMSQVLSEDQIVSVLSAMREDISGGRMSISVDTCWDIVMAILNWLTDNGTKECSRGFDGVYVPVESESEWPDLKPASEVIYTDNEFFKNFTTSSETDRSLTFIHKRVSLNIAECLQLTPLSEELDIAADTFEDTGQYEPLTTRLKNILRDYKDGLTIIKELIQNADDAEATDINICFDARTHCKDTSKLFFPEMCESHGPALVVQNNTVFSDEDFENITKLAGATKKNKHLKIGKFGIGFCSVYHITDIPSFLSRDRLYIFDPTLNHLGKEIKNPALPGKRLKFTTRIIQKSKQLDPYHGLFNFNRSESYNGTMFRLPFRTSPSELSGKCYSETTALELLDDIYNSSESLITFLQHVHTITYQRINNGETQPTTLFTVHKEEVPLPRTLVHECTTALSVASKKNLEAKSSTWLVSQHSTSNGGEKDAVASIACKLTESSPGVYGVDKSLTGEVFCYLPLSLSTGLPVHVSCNFAVINNRRGIWTAEESAASADETEVSWNIFLMENAIPEAYLKLLLTLKDMQKTNMLDNYTFHDLWPLTSELRQQNPWSIFVSNLYGELSAKELFFSESRKEWKSMSDSKFLAPNILSKSETDQYVLEILIHLKLPLVNLPVKYRDQFDLRGVLINEVGFIKLFFSNLIGFEYIIGSRNAVLHLMLEALATGHHNNTTTSTTLQGCMKGVACIPCSPDGMCMKKCDELVHPEATFSKLYDVSEGMFPFNELLKGGLVELALTHLGIIKKSIPWSYVIERAQTVKPLMNSDSQKAYTRIKNIIEAMTSHTDGSPPLSIPSIDTVEFLPVMKKPDDFFLTWPGNGVTLGCGKEMMLSGSGHSSSLNVTIAGSQCMFLCEADPQDKGCGQVYHTARNLLGLRASPSLTEVVSHLKAVIDQCSSSDKPGPKWTSETCKDIYHFIDNKLGQDSEVNLSELHDVACIWNEEQFLDADSVAISWKMSHGPYLFKAPPALASMKKLSKALQIKDSFTSQDAVNALQKMKSEFEDEPIDEPCARLVTELVSIFNSQPLNSDRDAGSTVNLPDTKGVLHKSSLLVYNDAQWAPLDDSHLQVSTEFSRELAIRLGVRPVRMKMLEKHMNKHFRPFGQHEHLTTRIQNIIEKYPFDITVLKELLQNADDAKAKKMYVILDKRTHDKKSVISEKWEELQGPAMLVWNDSVFTEKNLKGIQDLGSGSKSTESDSIGQYGIGFNVVYHITDCPSFVTKDGDTLCFMDPHCKYVPESADSEHSLAGGRYDDLNTDFWKKFPDMSTAYLQDNLKHSSQTFKDGTLFRFPIRHSKKMMQSSKIVKDINSEPLSPGGLAEKLMTWMPDMKKAMLFLNHVNEIKYIEIDTHDKLITKFHFKAEIEKSKNYGRSFKELRDAISSFSESSGYKSCVIHYPLTVTQVGSDHKQVKWLIQQGIGDIHDKDQTWQSDIASTVKPRHGIAAALQPQMSYNERKKEGQLFCFLPLPDPSNMPVHINGCFMLDSSSRRSLWKSTDPRVQDDKCRWNDSLKKAVASSYADFLVNAKKHFLHASYKGWKQALDDLKNYYSLFPKFPIIRQTKWDTLQCNVYKHLLQDNAEVLCVFTTSKKGSNLKILVEWYPLLSEKLVDQVHYWAGTSGSERKIIHPILESLGLKVSSVPADIMDCFNRISKKLYKENHLQDFSVEFEKNVSEEYSPVRDEHRRILSQGRDDSEEHIISPKINDSEGHRSIPCISSASVFKYYTKHSQFSSTQGMLPCPIEKTVFNNLENFLVFTKYLLKCPLATDPKVSDKVSFYEDGSVLHVESDASITTQWFPDSPFTHFLLLSADGMLRKFDNNHKILNSEYSTLFPNHLDVFLHPALRNISFDSSYFMSSDGKDKDNEDKEKNLRLIFDVFKGTFPQEMDGAFIVRDAPTVIDKEKLTKYWDCFSHFKVFSSYLPEILKHWAFLYTTDNRLYSTSNAVLPTYIPSEPDDLEKCVCCIMTSLQMPFLDSTVVTADVDCPKLSEHDKMLESFYHTNVSIPGSLTAVIKQTKHMDTLIDYFSKNSSPGNPKWVKQISSLPFFEDVEGTYSPIVGKKVYLWPSSACSAGYNYWASDCVLLVRAEAKWTNLASAKQLSIHTISAEKLYMEYIFPKFYQLKESDRYLHLEHIRRELFSVNLNNTNCSSTQFQDANDFIAALKALKWIGKDHSSLQPISAFSDPAVEIFSVFSDDYQKAC